MASGGSGGGEGSVASDPDFAAVCSFLHVFGPSYGIESPSISELQRILEDTQEVSEVLKDLQLKLLRRALKSVRPERWERSLVKYCHQQGLHKEAWELERFSYKKASAKVKLAVLKVLLEYQFTCHVKFKTAVNARPSSELRLEPVGRDRSGRVYWLQTDQEANLRLYREDQDEETWTLIARDREGLVKVINQLKSGEDASTVDESLLNEDSNSLETTPQKHKIEQNDDSNEEFLSPDSESDHDSDASNENESKKEKQSTSLSDNLQTKEGEDASESISKNSFCKDSISDTISDPKPEELKHDCNTENKTTPEKPTSPETQESIQENKEEISTETVGDTKDIAKKNEDLTEKEQELKLLEKDCAVGKDTKEMSEESVGPAIEEPVMMVTGEGNGADCESGDLGIWDEITEPVMYFWGDGCGFDCDTGNTGETATEVKCDNKLSNTESSAQKENTSDKTNLNKSDEETNNGKLSSDIDSSTCKNIKKLENDSEKIKGEHSHQMVSKRLLQETIEIKSVESTPKKSCIWNVESIVKKSESQDDKSSEIKSEKNGCNNTENTQDSTNVQSLDISPQKSLTSNDHDSKDDEIDNSTKLISEDVSLNKEGEKNVEKRKSSLSSEDEKSNKLSERRTPKGKVKAKTRSKENKVLAKPEIERIPPKKLRLDSSTDDCDKDLNIANKIKSLSSRSESKPSESQISKSKSSNSLKVEPSESKLDDSGIVSKKSRVEDSSKVSVNEKTPNDKTPNENVQTDEKSKEPESEEHTPQRVTKKVVRGRNRRLIKRTLVKEKPEEELEAESDSDKNLDEIANKKSKPRNEAKQDVEKLTPVKKDHQVEKRKRTRTKVDSVSEEENEDAGTGKRLKMKPKKVLLSSRKKVEAKLNNLKDSSEESEEAEVTTRRGKSKRSSSPKKEVKEKSGKKAKKKLASEAKKKSPVTNEDTPVRQSRRIAQLKIREEAERRQMEEEALRDLKMKHKKKMAGDGEEEWRASGEGSSSSEGRARAPRRRPQSDSSAPASDSDTDEPLFEREYEEPDLEFKSDHEFSPESDLEDGEDAQPLKRARTLKEEEDGFCVRCGRGDQPEWILLCDDCDAGFHASCLKPVLFLVPDGDWYCPPCQHERLIKSLEAELVKYDALAIVAEKEMKQRRSELAAKKEAENAEGEKKSSEGEKTSSSSDWSSSDEGTVYRLRERRQLPVSLRAQEYDRLMSCAIKEEYKEPTSSAGNQGRGKDISTIIEAAEEEKAKAEAAQQQGAGAEGKRKKTPRARRKPRKLNSLEVPSEDDETDEDFKDTGWESSSESISSDAEGDAGDSDSRSSDSLPIRRSGRDHHKSRKKVVESPELKKKKGVFEETTSDSSGTKEWDKKKKSSPKKKRDRTSPKKPRRKKGLKQYDAEGNVIKTRVRYGGLSGSEESNDWSPKHRTRQKKINYTEMPNTESEDEMHKPSGKHMPDSSDEFKLSNSDQSTDSESGRRKKKRASSEERETAMDDLKVNTLKDLVTKTAVVPLQKLPEDVTKLKTEALEAELNARVEAAVGTATPRPSRGKGSRGGRGSRGPRGGGRASGGRAGTSADDPGANLVGVKIKELTHNPDLPPKPNQIERERKRQERDARIAEKEARKLDRIKKKEEKEQMKEQKAKEREDKRQAKIALMESKRQRKEKAEGLPVPIPIAGMEMPRQLGPRPPLDMQRMPININQQYGDFPRARAEAPRLQVRPELRAMRPDLANVRAHYRREGGEGTLSVAGSPQPFKPASDPPSIITRMPHMIPPQYRGSGMYVPGSPYGPPPHGARPPHMMYMHGPHPLDPSPSGGGPINMNNRAFHPGYYPPRGYPPPRFHGEPGHASSPGPHGTPPGSHGGPPGSHGGPPGSHGGPPGSHGGPPGIHSGSPGSHGSHAGPASNHGGPPGSHGGHPGNHGVSGSHEPPGTHGGPPGSHGGPPGGHGGPAGGHGGPAGGHGGPAGVHSGPPGGHGGPSGGHGGPPGGHGGPPGGHGVPPGGHGIHPGSHGGPQATHAGSGQPHGPPGSHVGPPGSHRGPPGPHSGPAGHHTGPPGNQGGPPHASSPVSHPGQSGTHGGPPVLHSGPHNTATGPQRPPSAPQGRKSPPGPVNTLPGPPEHQIKAEIKTEPETNSPSQSPARMPSPPQDEQRPILKMKHTESKERARTTMAARYPHGPYAPQYGPYGPYAPPEGYSPSVHPQMQPQRPMHTTPPPRMPSHHPGQPPHHQGPPSHHQGPPPHHQGPSPHHPGPSPHHPGQQPHGPPSHHPAQQSHHPGPPAHHAQPHHSVQMPHPGQTSHHPGQPPIHPGALPSHHGPPGHHHGPPLRHMLAQHRPHMSHHSGPPPMHRPPPNITHQPHQSPISHPSSPIRPLQSTPPPALPRRTDPIHLATKATESANDSVNLVSHNRLQSPPPVTCATPPKIHNPDADRPVALTVSSASNEPRLTPIDASKHLSQSKVTELHNENAREGPSEEGIGVLRSNSPPPTSVPPPAIAAPSEEGGSVFGGLVSYFSSQHEDDIDD